MMHTLNTITNRFCQCYMNHECTVAEQVAYYKLQREKFIVGGFNINGYKKNLFVVRYNQPCFSR